MKTIISAALISLAAGSAAFAAVEPIPGSITYDNANVQLEKAPWPAAGFVDTELRCFQ